LEIPARPAARKSGAAATGAAARAPISKTRCLDTPLRKALLDRYGEEALSRLAEGHGEFQSVFNCSKAERVLGWKPAHSWRSEDGE
jgi:hypothetical protein